MDEQNILLIMSDQLRFDTLRFMEHSIAKTPHIDILVGEGA